ncbi:MAG: hypothetical protein Q7S84_02445 [bacterium]|nr:hypothetical protein [bacterium]
MISGALWWIPQGCFVIIRNMPPEQPQNSPDGSGETEHDPLAVWLELMKASAFSNEMIVEHAEELARLVRERTTTLRERMDRAMSDDPAPDDDIEKVFYDGRKNTRRRELVAGMLRAELERMGGMEAELRILDRIMQSRDSTGV